MFITIPHDSPRVVSTPGRLTDPGPAYQGPRRRSASGPHRAVTVLPQFFQLTLKTHTLRFVQPSLLPPSPRPRKHHAAHGLHPRLFPHSTTPHPFTTFATGSPAGQSSRSIRATPPNASRNRASLSRHRRPPSTPNGADPRPHGSLTTDPSAQLFPSPHSPQPVTAITHHTAPPPSGYRSTRPAPTQRTAALSFHTDAKQR